MIGILVILAPLIVMREETLHFFYQYPIEGCWDCWDVVIGIVVISTYH